MPTPVERIAALLTRDGANYRCPAHDDAHGSLSVAEGRDGRALVHCHAGCEARDVLAAIGLTERDLFAGNGSMRPAAVDRATIAARNNAVLLAARDVRRTVYPYTDENGVQLFRVVRDDHPDGSKTFEQKRADGVPSLDGVRRVLYQLPGVIEAAALGKDIHLVEGEKCADALRETGLTATTVAGGSNARLTDEMAEVLRGATVIIHADNDSPGRACAETRAARLAAVAATVKVVHYPDLPEKGDVFDAVAAGATADDIRVRADAAPVWEPSTTTDAASNGPQVFSLSELFARPELLAVPPALVAGFVFPERLSALAGPPKSGKSTFAACCAAAVSRGGSMLGARAMQGAALWIKLEGHLNDVVPLFRNFGADPEYLDVATSLPGGLPDIYELAGRRRYSLIVIDTLAALFDLLGVDDYNSAAKVLPIVTPLANLAHDGRVAIMVLHHAAKATGRIRDSSAIAGAVDVLAELHDPEDKTTPTRRDFRVRGRVSVRDFSVTFADNSYGFADADAPLEMRVLDAIRTATANGGTLSKSAVRLAVRGAVGKTDAALQALSERGLVIFERGAGYSVPLSSLAASDSNGPEW